MLNQAPFFSMLFKFGILTEVVLLVPVDDEHEEGVWMLPDQFLQLVADIKADKYHDAITEAQYAVDQAVNRKE